MGPRSLDLPRQTAAPPSSRRCPSYLSFRPNFTSARQMIRVSRKPIELPTRSCGWLIRDRRGPFRRSSDMAQRRRLACQASGRCDTRGDVPIGSNPRPLSGSERAFFEPRFGRDFRHVRLHSDATTARSAESLKARAFTFGREIAFAPGQYQPATNRGRKLLAHELTHTLQQQTMAQPLVQRAKHTGQGDYLDPDNCWVEGETKGPTSTVIGRFIGILDVPEKCEGAIKMTVRFEAIGGWSVTSWLGPSAAPLLFTPSAVGVDPALFVKGKPQATDSSFEYDISYPLTPENCPTQFDAYLLVTWRRPAHKPNFAEVKFSPKLFIFGTRP